MTDADADAAAPSLRERNRLRTRRAILEAVVEIELAHGGSLDPSLLTFAKIAEVAGVSERTVYRFFPTKDDLDRAYATEQPLTLDLELTVEPSVRDYPDVIEAVMQRWSARLGHRRVNVAEPGSEEYPVATATRQGFDAAFADDLMAIVPGSDALSPRQRLAIVAAVHSTRSIRTIAITAQRWGLTLEEAGRAHAWVLRSLLDTITTTAVEPWEETR